MNHRLLATVAACTLAVSATIGSGEAAGLLAAKDPTSGVVLIDTVLAGGGQGAGTGMVLTASGQVLTNNHVVEDSTTVTVTVPDTGATYTATVLGTDADRDVALLQLEDASSLETVSIDDDGVSVGDAVTAIGNANGEGEIVQADGEVTGLESTVEVSDGTALSALTGMIETNAEAVPGDSGGPMVDAEGEVVGMTTAGGQELTAYPRQVPAQVQQGERAPSTTTTTTISYAVPIEDALAIVEQILAGDESGTVQVGPSGYLGVSVGDYGSGVAVMDVEAGTPAAEAGIEAGSVITAVAGERVRSTSDLASALAETEPGEQVTISWTDASGAAQSATVTLGSSPVN